MADGKHQTEPSRSEVRSLRLLDGLVSSPFLTASRLSTGWTLLPGWFDSSRPNTQPPGGADTPCFDGLDAIPSHGDFGSRVL